MSAGKVERRLQRRVREAINAERVRGGGYAAQALDALRGDIRITLADRERLRARLVNALLVVERCASRVSQIECRTLQALSRTIQADLLSTYRWGERPPELPPPPSELHRKKPAKSTT